MLHPERESLYCSTHMGVMPPTSVLAGNKTVCTVGMSGKQSKCLCMSHGENIPHHQVWTSPLALLIRWARAMLFARGLDEPAFALQPLSSCLFERPLPSPSVVSSRTKKPSASVPVWVLASHLATASESECNIARYQANYEFFSELEFKTGKFFFKPSGYGATSSLHDMCICEFWLLNHEIFSWADCWGG